MIAGHDSLCESANANVLCKCGVRMIAALIRVSSYSAANNNSSSNLGASHMKAWVNHLIERYQNWRDQSFLDDTNDRGRHEGGLTEAELARQTTIYTKRGCAAR